MIKVSNALQGINFNLDTEGVETFIKAFESISDSQSFEIDKVIFTDKEGNTTFRKLLLKIEDDNTIKIKEKEIHLSLELEDVEYSFELFTKSKETGIFESPEWLQATNLSNKKNYYLYVFFVL